MILNYGTGCPRVLDHACALSDIRTKRKQKHKEKKREKSSQNNPSRRIYHNILPSPQLPLPSSSCLLKKERNLEKKKKETIEIDSMPVGSYE